MKTARILLLFALAALAQTAAPQSAGTGLYVCQQGGATQIVSAKEKKPGCKPYQKGMLGKGNAMFAPNGKESGSAAPRGPIATPVKPPSGFVDVTTGERVQLSPDALSAGLRQSKDSSGKPNKKNSKNKDKKSKDSKTALNASATPAPAETYLYYCPDSRGGQIIEAPEAPSSSCQSVGKKANIQDPRSQPASAPAPAPAVQNSPFRKDRGVEISANDGPPNDIYKCFDKLGRPTFVAESETKNYLRCSFFSRSYASAQQKFRKDLQQPKSLTELAAAGVGAKDNKSEPTSSAAVRCVGAGSVQFNGSAREYNCATRSFDISAGTSGGQVVLGDKSAVIAAHNLDYFNTGGSCGGTITTADGRVLHLAPTKNCPAAFQIEARKIEQEYVRSISVNVSGAFLERQRQLSPQVNQIAAEVGIDPFLVHAVISAESAYKTGARSHVGAMGLMQLMPATARRFGVRDAYNTGENIRAGATYLKFLLNKFNGNYQLAIAAYNAGEGNVIKYGYKIPPFIETRAYVPKVMEYYRRYKANPAQVGLK